MDSFVLDDALQRLIDGKRHPWDIPDYRPADPNDLIVCWMHGSRHWFTLPDGRRMCLECAAHGWWRWD